MVISIDTHSCMSVSIVTSDEFMAIIIMQRSAFHAFRSVQLTRSASSDRSV